MHEESLVNPKRIWDLPTRIFHWALLCCVVGLVITGKLGGNAINLHELLGYAVLTLVSFRVLWGLVGGRWSRFVQFVPSWSRLKAYVRGETRSPAGHNPLGALSVLAMLVVLILQAVSGLFIDDEIAFTGPLYTLVSSFWVEVASEYHTDVGQFLLLGLVGLHVLAIGWHVHRHDRHLVRAMVHGNQMVETQVPASQDNWLTRLWALLLLMVCGFGVKWLISLGQVAAT
jgi:cytochrome b